VPGLFVRIRLPVGTRYDATLVSERALGTDQGRKFVYVVQEDKNDKGEVVHRAVYRPVTLGPLTGGMRVIRPARKGYEGKEGLAPGEQIIVSGLQRVRDRAEVLPREVKMPTGTGSPEPPANPRKPG
jgi:multidrug efflux pump subunit AcrA (membrane-fusion protein)